MSITHPELVAALTKPGADILATITPEGLNLLHMAVGISGEAGELLDAVKKVVIYNKPIDRENAVEELGDLEFYMEGFRAALGITRDEVLAANIAKLSIRYGEKYSDAAAQARADKNTVNTKASNIEPSEYTEKDMLPADAGGPDRAIGIGDTVFTHDYPNGTVVIRVKTNGNELLYYVTANSNDPSPPVLIVFPSEITRVEAAMKPIAQTIAELKKGE